MARKARSNAPQSSSPNLRASVATRSTRAGAISSPSAEATPALGGQITLAMPSRFATSQACSGPPPPVASNANWLA